MARLLEIKTITDDRGSLSVLDRDLPFEIKRVFYIHGVKKNRGGHGHLKSKTILIALSGSLDVVVQTPTENMAFHLDSPEKGLYLEAVDWHAMENFSSGAVLLVLASEHFENTDYFYEKYR